MGPQIWNHRSSLARTKQKMKEGKLVIGFIGGSITDGRPRHNWPEPVTAWFVDQFRNVRIVVENAAIGATGSDLAVLRAKRDLLDRGCDLIFIDYAVNDDELPTEKRMPTREGLIRKLLAGDCDRDGSEATQVELAPDIVLVHTYCGSMYDHMLAGEVPPSIAELEQLAEHYQLNSVWMGLYAFNEVQRGMMRWEEWLPDGLHPTSRGSYSYAQSVIALLAEQLGDDLELGHESNVGNRVKNPLYNHLSNRANTMPEPIDSNHWQAASVLPLDSIQLEGAWVTKRWTYYEWFDQVVETCAIGAKLSFHFTGRGVALAFDFGKTSAEFKYRVDGGAWIEEQRERPDWAGADGWLRISRLEEDLPEGDHFFELEVIRSHDPASVGANFRLGIVGIIK